MSYMLKMREIDMSYMLKMKERNRYELHVEDEGEE